MTSTEKWKRIESGNVEGGETIATMMMMMMMMIKRKKKEKKEYKRIKKERLNDC